MIEQTATKATDVLLTQGVLGVLSVLLILALIVAGLVIRSLHSDNKALNAQALSDRTALVTAVEASTDATERFEAVLREIRATLDVRHQTVADLSQRVELIARDAQHGLRNVSQAIAGIAHLLGQRRTNAREPAPNEDEPWGPR